MGPSGSSRLNEGFCQGLPVFTRVGRKERAGGVGARLTWVQILA